MLTTRYFDVPGHATRRSFAVYVAVAVPENGGDVELYVGKTGDNRDGCNPVISRAGNHFSHNKIHSQLRNKLSRDSSTYGYRYFYFSLAPYIVQEIRRREHIDITNEVERRVNSSLQTLIAKAPNLLLLNPFGNVAYVPIHRRRARDLLVNQEINSAIHKLCKEAVRYARRRSAA